MRTGHAGVLFQAAPVAQPVLYILSVYTRQRQTGELRGCTVAVCALSACRKAVSDTLVCSFLAPL